MGLSALLIPSVKGGGENVTSYSLQGGVSSILNQTTILLNLNNTPSMKGIM